MPVVSLFLKRELYVLLESCFKEDNPFLVNCSSLSLNLLIVSNLCLPSITSILSALLKNIKGGISVPRTILSIKYEALSSSQT